MAADRLSSFLFFCLILSGMTSVTVKSASFTISNSCSYTIWPGILANAGSTPLSSTGFELKPGGTVVLTAPSGGSSWSGRFWARTVCSADSAGKFSCLTGDCGSGKVECNGLGAASATLAEFTLAGSNGLDFYDVSLVDGFNVPVLVSPVGGTSGNCTVTGCLADLNSVCPSALKVTSAAGIDGAGGGGSAAVACRSACDAFGDAQYCCSGAYSNPNTCKPSPYSLFFKNACPRAYSYAYDDGTSTFTCAGADYSITFCPAVPSQRSSSGQYPQAAVPLINNTMIFSGVPDHVSMSGCDGLTTMISLFWTSVISVSSALLLLMMILQ